MIKLIECPRDAMQGIIPFIPTAEKAAYLNLLLQVGFDTLDFGSFVSPKAIPQMRDTAEVLSLLDLSDTQTGLLAIVANVRGAQEASGFPQIRYLGYPFSVSETFQLRNTNAGLLESMDRVAEIQEICAFSGKQLVLYLSMGFGNPYGDIPLCLLLFNGSNFIHCSHASLLLVSNCFLRALTGPGIGFGSLSIHR